MLLALGLLVVAAWPALAAEVVEVRVGRHPEFTRVVFELDRAAGYRIERSAPGAMESELIVSLEAGSIPRRIQSTKSFIEQVVVEPSGGRSVARIRLARGGLKLKEMILASPPRIVLDVIAEGSAPGTAATTAAKASTTKAASPPSPPSKTALTRSTPAPTPAPNTAANTKLAPTATTAAPGKPAPAATPARTPTPTPTPATAAIGRPSESASAGGPKGSNAAAAPETKLLASTEKSGSGAGDSGSEIELAANEGADALAEGTSSAADVDDLAAAPETDALAAAQATPAEAEAAAAAAAAGDAAIGRPMVVKSTSGDADGEGGGLMTWGLAGVGLAVAAFAGLVVARRRRSAAGGDDEYDAAAGSPFADADAEEDAATDEEDEEEAAEAPRSSRAETSNPFAGLSSGIAPLATGAAQGREMGAGSGAAASAPRAARSAGTNENKTSESLLFDDAEEKTMEGMEVISRSQASESLGGAMPMMGGASDELTQMFREMQRRVAALETRIDELVDARDRLERQVAAQTEELRVQRAAIARTQRAVRNLARPEDGGDDEPTEPALREPN